MYANDREIVTLSRENVFQYHFGNDGFDALGDPDLYDYGLGKSKFQKFLKRATGNDPILLRPFSKASRRKIAHTVTGAASGCATGFVMGGGPWGCVVGAAAGAVAGAGTPWSKNKDRWQGQKKATGKELGRTAVRGAVAGAVAGTIYGAYAGTGVGGAAKAGLSNWWTGGAGAGAGTAATTAGTTTAVTTGAGTAAASSAGILGTGITWGEVGQAALVGAGLYMKAAGGKPPEGCPTGYVQVAEGCMPQGMSEQYGDPGYGAMGPMPSEGAPPMSANPAVLPADPMTKTPAGTPEMATFSGGGGGPGSAMHAGNPDYLPSDYELAQMAMREEEARRRASDEKPDYTLWIIGGIALAGGAYYLYTRKKKTRKPLSGRK